VQVRGQCPDQCDDALMTASCRTLATINVAVVDRTARGNSHASFNTRRRQAGLAVTCWQSSLSIASSRQLAAPKLVYIDLFEKRIQKIYKKITFLKSVYTVTRISGFGKRLRGQIILVSLPLYTSLDFTYPQTCWVDTLSTNKDACLLGLC